MANLAIKGHATRGKEVIEILEMLVGNNPHKYIADSNCFGFYINDNTKTIYYDWLYDLDKEDVTILTLEEFLEKYPYKIGDKVIYHESKAYIKSMRWDGIEIVYKVECNKELWDTTMFYLQPYKEEIMKEKLEQITLDIPKGYEFFGINDDNQVVLAKKQLQYPKTYDECCGVLGMTFDYPDIRMVSTEEFYLYSKFIQLKRCRDAYWKIAGEEMGLGKRWNQDYHDRCFIIANNKGDIYTTEYHGSNNVILAFPTAEMRDTFYDNFKELIEECKDLL